MPYPLALIPAPSRWRSTSPVHQLRKSNRTLFSNTNRAGGVSCVRKYFMCTPAYMSRSSPAPWLPSLCCLPWRWAVSTTETILRIFPQLSVSSCARRANSPGVSCASDFCKATSNVLQAHDAPRLKARSQFIACFCGKLRLDRIRGGVQVTVKGVEHNGRRRFVFCPSLLRLCR